MNGPLVDPRAVAAGAGIALAICVPAAILAQVLDDAGTASSGSAWLVVLSGVIVAGMGIGGFAAGRRRLDAPLSNGALAALAAYLLVQAVGAVRLLASGDDVTWAAIPFFALLSIAAGVTGALVADRRARAR